MVMEVIAVHGQEHHVGALSFNTSTGLVSKFLYF